MVSQWDALLFDKKIDANIHSEGGVEFPVGGNEIC